MQYHNDTIIKTQEDFFNKYIYLSLYCKGSKRLFKVLLWEGVGDRTELQYTDPHSYGRQRCVSEFKPVKLCLKIDLVSYPAWAGRGVNIYDIAVIQALVAVRSMSEQ